MGMTWRCWLSTYIRCYSDWTANAFQIEVTSLQTNAGYNGKALLGSDANSINIQVDYNNGDQTALKTYSVSASSLGLESAGFLAANKAAAGITARLSQMAIVAANGGDVIQYCLDII